MPEEMTQGQFCWNELVTPDPKKAKEFYTKLFGWKTEEMQMPDMTYTIFKNGDKGIGGMLQTPKGQEKNIPPHWMSYIWVDDLEAMLKKAQDLGATVMVPPKQAGDMGTLAIITDPTGAHIAFWKAAKK